jgi:predicted nucleotidyltransferase
MAMNPINNKTINNVLQTVNLDKLKEFCHKNHILSLKFFGSIFTEKFNVSSDIDILIEFEPNFIPGYFKFINIEREFSKLFNRKVDLRTKDELSQYFREDVLKLAVKVYD